MIEQQFRSRFTQPDWEVLQLSIALVSLDAAVRVGNDLDEGWGIVRALTRIGVRAASRNLEENLALAVLADFAEEFHCHEMLVRARNLGRLTASQLQEHIDQATVIVDRVSPEQSFRFRVTLTLVSMLVSEAAQEFGKF